jgi:Sodium:neurotransmitter symporter family.
MCLRTSQKQGSCGKGIQLRQVIFKQLRDSASKEKLCCLQCVSFRDINTVTVSAFSGVGYATMTIVFFLDIYYCIIIAWTIFYLIATFVRLPGLPWQTCGTLGTLIWFVLPTDESSTGYSKTDIASQVHLRRGNILVFHCVPSGRMIAS